METGPIGENGVLVIELVVMVPKYAAVLAAAPHRYMEAKTVQGRESKYVIARYPVQVRCLWLLTLTNN